jgi:hypothetical protein
MPLQVPVSLKNAHDALHVGLKRAMREPGRTGEAARMAQGLKSEMAQMVNEHRQIAELLRRLAQDAEAEGKPDYVELAEDMILHAQLEEDVLYPATLLIGEYAARLRKD